ncbi:MAG: prepilin-type N-terminal cleavage/methylation domain-containing protein [Opitutaceae bacterium]|nr:prepilin-type N-terminal cleavage/methylation domain-containing protein [Opitutaceae bacterium]
MPSSGAAISRVSDPCARSAHAFTLVEVMVVVTIIGSLGSISLPKVKKAADSARASAVVNDLRVLASAMSTIAQQSGSFPKDTARRKMPPAATGHTKPTTWTDATPIGGYYNWESGRKVRGTKVKAGIAINSARRQNVTKDRALLLAIDRRIDDGNLNTGNFRLGAGNDPFYIIEP